MQGVRQTRKEREMKRCQADKERTWDETYTLFKARPVGTHPGDLGHSPDPLELPRGNEGHRPCAPQTPLHGLDCAITVLGTVLRTDNHEQVESTAKILL